MLCLVYLQLELRCVALVLVMLTYNCSAWETEVGKAKVQVQSGPFLEIKTL